MFPRPNKLTLAVPIAVLAAVTPGCGGEAESGLLPEESASALSELLDEAARQFEQGSCDDLEATLSQLDREADKLPDAEVDAELRTTLNAEARELAELSSRCRPDEDETVPVPDETVPVPEKTVPVEPTTTEEETTPTEEETEEAQEEPPEPKPPKPPEPPQPPPEEEPPPEDPCPGNSPRC